jgi:hypothetical protein
MHGGRELVREEDAAEMEDMKGAANRDFERHSIAPEAGTKARKASGSVKRGEPNARGDVGMSREKNQANGGQLDGRRL